MQIWSSLKKRDTLGTMVHAHTKEKEKGREQKGTEDYDGACCRNRKHPTALSLDQENDRESDEALYDAHMEGEASDHLMCGLEKDTGVGNWNCMKGQ